MRALPSAVLSVGPLNLVGRLWTAPGPTEVMTLSETPVTFDTRDAGAGSSPLMKSPACFLSVLLATAANSATPMMTTTPTMIQVVRLLALPPFAAIAVRPLRCWGRRFGDRRFGCLLMRLLDRTA